MPVHDHWPEYTASRQRVLVQSHADDLFGRGELKYGDGPAEVKADALRQLEIEHRAGVNELATFWVDLHKVSKENR
jgi:hypothetical protein